MRLLSGIILLIPTLALGEIRLIHLKDQAPEGMVEIRGVEAGAFDPGMWKAGPPHLVPDVRHPLLEPREGAYRNIYAPSAVATPEGWRVFYGAWDGVGSGNDRIYSALTRDFLTFDDRRTVIEHGPFQHVCNVSAIGLQNGGFAMMCTMLPDAKGLNKPGFFLSADGKTWNGRREPAAARADDFIFMRGYAGFESADINGMNVILREEGKYRLYFNNFRDFGKTFRASSEDGRRFQFDGIVLSHPGMVNDVKMFHVGERTRYLIGLHHNGDSLMYSVSDSGLEFPPVQTLLRSRGEADRYIVSLGWVVRENRLLGVMYGAGAKPTLDANRIFARWVQKRVIWVDAAGDRVEAKGARGPDRAIFQIAGSGRFELYGANPEAPVAVSQTVKVRAGDVLQLTEGNSLRR